MLLLQSYKYFSPFYLLLSFFNSLKNLFKNVYIMENRIKHKISNISKLETVFLVYDVE